MEYWAAGHPLYITISILTPNLTRFSNSCTKFSSLVIRTPERCADRHRCKLPAGVLERIGFTRHATVLLGQSRVEHSAEVHVTGRAAGGDDNTLSRPDVQDLAFARRRDADNLSR